MRYKMGLFAFLIIMLHSYLGAENMNGKASLILYNGTVYTLNESQPNAQAIAVNNDKILFVGSNETALELKGDNTKAIDLEGATVLPGLSDAHMHLIGLGKSLLELNLVGTASKEEIIRKVQQASLGLAEGAWIIGRGWDQNDWAIKEFPSAQDLDQATLIHPVILSRIDGHAIWVNSKAMALAGITEETKDPEGGQVIRDKNSNKQTGVLIDNAEELIRKIVPHPTKEQMKAFIIKGMQNCVANGVTMIHDAGATLDEIAIYKELLKEKKLSVRIYVMLSVEKETLDYYFKKGPEINLDANMLIVRAIKLFADGAMGSRGAAFFEPYNDDPANRGLLLIEQKKLQEYSISALKKGFQICTHAIGDKANAMTLETYRSVLKKNNDARFRIEHAQVVRRSDIHFFADYNVIASMQPVHATSDMYWAEQRIGEKRIEGAYAWRRFLDNRVIIAGGSDAPVEDINPLLGIYAAVTRKDLKNYPENGWYPDQKLTIMEAIKLFTINPAYAAFMEKSKGIIKKGYKADFTVLDKDITKVPFEQIPSTKVIYTIVEGTVK